MQFEFCDLRKIRLLLFLVFLFCLPSIVFAGTETEIDKSISIALKAAHQKEWTQLKSLTFNNRQPELKLLGNWLCYRSHHCPASFDEISHFVEKKYFHLDRGAIIESAELILIREKNYAKAIPWFNKYFPTTYNGISFYLEAYKNVHGQAQYKQKVKEFWRNQKMSSQFQRQYYKHYKDLLTQEDHIERFNFLVHEKKYIMASRIADLVTSKHRSLINAKTALARDQPHISDLINKIPKELVNDETLNYLRLRWRHKKRLEKGAFELIETPHIKFPHNADMWRERDYYARLYLQKNFPKKAYKLVSSHGVPSGSAMAEAEFFSGWIALKYLHDYDLAISHFKTLQKKTKTPISQSRALYWLGVAYQMKKDTSLTRKYFQAAANFPTTYYGQIACQRTACRIQSFFINKMGIPSHKVRDFDNDERVRLAKTLMRHDQHLTRKVLDSLSHSAQEKENHFLIAELAISLGFIDLSTKISRHAVNKNMGVFSNAYPLLQESISTANQNHALTHAVIRQESNFKTQAISPVGARGLAQLMPNTARMMAQKNKVPYSLARLTTDPHYNIKLGTSYLNHLLAKYDGSKILALAAYNAGPGRVSQWLKANGDPRHPQISEIDWIEKITLQETRNYVQRVLENFQVYQLKLNNHQLKNRMISVSDLN